MSWSWTNIKATMHASKALRAPVESHFGVPLSKEEILCVDLDGTLIRTDSLQESFLLFLRAKPQLLFHCLFWLCKGKGYLKYRLASIAKPNPELLPYRESVLQLLRTEQQKGRHICLATGADSSIALSVANYLGLFQTVLASSEQNNLTGTRKLAALRDRFGSAPLAYMGDSREDRSIWADCQTAIPVGPAASRAKILRLQGLNVQELEDESSWSVFLRGLLKLMRPHHWVKNLLVFVPVVLAHRVFDWEILGAASLAFVCLSLIASALYVANDLLDIEADRVHPRKRSRPLAAGQLLPLQAIFLGVVLLGLAGVLLLPLPPLAVGLLAGYGLTSLLYSLFLKPFLFMDVIALAGLFTLRILIGGAATGIVISEWTLAFSLFVFLSLALGKRLSEIRASERRMSERLSHRGYLVLDSQVVASLGAASSCAAILVFFLFISSASVAQHYSRPGALWLIGPLFLYWFGRFWILVNRGFLHDDPIVFAFRDRASLVFVALVGLLVVFAK